MRGRAYDGDGFGDSEGGNNKIKKNIKIGILHNIEKPSRVNKSAFASTQKANNNHFMMMIGQSETVCVC